MQLISINGQEKLMTNFSQSLHDIGFSFMNYLLVGAKVMFRDEEIAAFKDKRSKETRM